MAGDSLRDYRKKRDASQTPEPFGDSGVARPRAFVIQQHAARRMHWDLRLEIDGVLKSWAVPRGPSLDPGDKRLAVRTEDHPLDYVDFEAVIPEGNYGAGAMIVWDRGRWTLLDDPQGTSVEEGKLLFELHGFKLRGRWTLVRTKSDAGNEWLLIKKEDAWSGPRNAEEGIPAESVLSGLTVEQLADGASAGPEVEAELVALDAPPGALTVDEIDLVLAEQRDEPFSDPDWLYELKYDGYRLLVGADDGVPRLRYRRGKDVTTLYPDIARAAAALPYDRFVIDGELVVLDDDGTANFQRLQGRGQLSRPMDVEGGVFEDPCTFYAFDLLSFAGHDLRSLPLTTRKTLLHRLLPGQGILRYADHVERAGIALYEQVRKLGLEGIMAKRADAPYRGGRTSDWLKIRSDATEPFLIVGYRPPRDADEGVGAVHVAAHRDGELVYAGRVGSGFDDRARRDLASMLQQARIDDCPAAAGPKSSKEDRWVEPRFACQVRYKEWTDGGHLRQPVFLRLLGEVARPSAPLAADSRAEPPPRDELKLKNRTKVFWPESGYTKGDLLDYYERVAPRLLPYLGNRPLTVERYPDGVDGTSFYQKNTPEWVPDWIRTVPVWSHDSQRTIHYPICDSLQALLFVVNLGAIPLHVWASRVDRLEHPDWCILDLDPKEAPFEDVVTLARATRELCEEIELDCYVKTSGSTGLHVLVPLGGQMTYEQSRLLAELLARVVAQRHREIATTARTIAARGGKVYLDYLQNRRGQLLVAPLSVRPKPGATVSAPLEWDEVIPGLDLRDFTIETVPDRLDTQGDPVVPVLSERPALTTALGRLAEIVS